MFVAKLTERQKCDGEHFHNLQSFSPRPKRFRIPFIPFVPFSCTLLQVCLEKSGKIREFFSVWTLESGNTDSGCATGEAANTPLAVLTLSLERFMCAEWTFYSVFNQLEN